jgi:hypothetical protein
MKPLADFFQSWKKVHKPFCEILVCVYTCDQHRHLLKKFRESPVGQYLSDLPGAKILEVYANPGIPKSYHHGTELLLRTAEEYRALSLKTQVMMEYCVRHFDFDRLIKIDVTTVMVEFKGPEYKGRTAIDPEELLYFLQNSPADLDYDGFILHARPSRQNVEDWAAKKGLVIDCQKIFGNQPIPQFFSGKCYLVSRRFAEFIGTQGRKMAEEHMDYFPGAEDLMVGRLYRQFLGTLS